MTAPQAPDIVAAQLAADAARADLSATLAQLQSRVHPRAVARDALDAVRDRGEDLAERGVEFVRARPAVTAGIAAAAILLFARKPIVRLFSRRHATAAPERG